VISGKRFTGVRLDADLLAGLERLRAIHGASISESIRRAVREYLKRRQVITKAARRRADTRKRA
jgi:metal-responsive CopG/Arc/MetJ family transcriptional regulator